MPFTAWWQPEKQMGSAPVPPTLSSSEFPLQMDPANGIIRVHSVPHADTFGEKITDRSYIRMQTLKNAPLKKLG